jgi:hypothetical protein
MTLIDQKDGWYLSFQNGLVQLIQIDFRVGLFFSDNGDTAQLYIETPFRLERQSKEFLLTPSESAGLAPVLPLFNMQVIGITVKKTGRLIVGFVDGSSLEVEADDFCEAWQLGGSIDFMLVCSPGGPVSMFSRDRDLSKPSVAS